MQILHTVGNGQTVHGLDDEIVDSSSESRRRIIHSPPTARDERLKVKPSDGNLNIN